MSFLSVCGLTNIKIPESVTSIGECSFDGCIGLTSIDIPESVKNIGRTAFGYTIDSDGYVHKIDNFTIRGKKGSAAESYANKEEVTFEQVG